MNPEYKKKEIIECILQQMNTQPSISMSPVEVLGDVEIEVCRNDKSLGFLKFSEETHRFFGNLKIRVSANQLEKILHVLSESE